MENSGRSQFSGLLTSVADFGGGDFSRAGHRQRPASDVAIKSICLEVGMKLNRKSDLSLSVGNTGRSSLLNLEEINSHKIDYSASSRWPQNASTYMILLVGAAR